MARYSPVIPASLQTPTAARALPFFVWVVLTSLQGQFGPASAYWLYALKTVIGAWMIWSVRGIISELRWTFNPISIGTGILLFALWVGLDGYYPPLGQLFSKTATPPPSEWNPFQFFGQSSALAWGSVGLRIVGTALVVPPIEEAFYRSLMYRSIAQPNFEAFPLNRFSLKAFLITSVVFGLVHPNQWIAGILCGLAFQWLALRRGDLGESMVAHGVTNLLLGIYVVAKGAWKFW